MKLVLINILVLNEEGLFVYEGYAYNTVEGVFDYSTDPALLLEQEEEERKAEANAVWT